MVSVSKTAVTECIEDTLTVRFNRCSRNVSSTQPVIFVNVPDPVSILFNISAFYGSNTKKLTPVSGAASFAPFINTLTQTSSDFRLEVFFDDGTSVDSYANEKDSETVSIVYFPLDSDCTVIDNSNNTVTIKEGATCTSAQVGVNVTFGTGETAKFFQAFDEAPVVRLQSVTTSASVFPSGTTGMQVTAMNTLPCNAGFERFTLSTVGTLEDGNTGTLTPYMTYAPTDDVRFTIINDVILTATSENVSSLTSSSTESLLGSTTTEFHSGQWSDFSSISVSAFSIKLRTEFIIRIYTGTVWNDLPGGSDTSASASSTLNLVQDGTLSTSYTLQYEHANHSVSFSNLMSSSYSSWYDYKNMIEFSADSSSIIDVDSSGTLTLKDNHYAPVTVSSKLCSSGVWYSPPNSISPTPKKKIWANLRSDFDDVNIGIHTGIQTNSNEYYSPFYTESTDPTVYENGGTMDIYVGANPKSGQYLRAVELTITFPDSYTESGNTHEILTNADSSSSTFTKNTNNGYTISSNFNFQSDCKVLKIVAAHTSTIPSSGYVYIGKWTIPKQTLFQDQLLSTTSIRTDIQVLTSTTAAQSGSGTETSISDTCLLYTSPSPRD